MLLGHGKMKKPAWHETICASGGEGDFDEARGTAQIE